MKHSTDSESPNIVQWTDEWYGTVTMCKTCETSFMIGNFDDLNYCPRCGRYLRIKTKDGE